MENQPSASTSPTPTSSMPSTGIGRPNGPRKHQVEQFLLLIGLTISLWVWALVAIIKNEPMSILETLFATILIQTLLILCGESRKISAAIIEITFKQRVRVVRFGPGTQKYYTLPENLSYIASSPNNDDDRPIRYGRFERFIEGADPAGIVGWVGFASIKDFSSRGFLSRFVRSEGDLVGTKVYEVAVEKAFKGPLERWEENVLVVKPTGRVVGEVLGICEAGPGVAVKIEDWFVQSDGWKMGAWREAGAER